MGRFCLSFFGTRCEHAAFALRHIVAVRVLLLLNNEIFQVRIIVCSVLCPQMLVNVCVSGAQSLAGALAKL